MEITAEYFSLSNTYSMAFSLINETGDVAMLIAGFALAIVVVGSLLRQIRETLG